MTAERKFYRWKNHKLQRCNVQCHMYWFPDDNAARKDAVRMVRNCRCYDCATVLTLVSDQPTLTGLVFTEVDS